MLSPEISGPLVAAVALSMVLTPLLLLVYERVVQPRFALQNRVERDADPIDEQGPVIIAGFGSFGSTVRALAAGQWRANHRA